MKSVLALALCLVGLVFAQDQCQTDIEEYFSCKSDAKALRPDRETVKATVDGCFAGCDGTPGSLKPEGAGSVFECIRGIKDQVKEECEDELNLPFDLPDHRGGPGHHGHHGPPGFGPPGFPVGPRGGRGFGNQQGQRRFRFGQRQEAPGQGRPAGHRGPGGRGGRRDFMNRAINELCEAAGLVDTVSACVEQVMSDMREQHEATRDAMEVCRDTFEQTGCQEELGDIRQEMCECVQEKMNEQTNVDALNACTEGSRFGQFMLRMKDRMGQRMCGHHRN